ncbi:hypothetical protein KC356_g8023 [Hortaea werneckii]|nr:hypothetical protein KC356_g8023 [Hortaea werneckii]
MLRDACSQVRTGQNSPAVHRSKRVAFHHPGYGDSGDNVLIRLPAPDGQQGGITYDFALEACAILACNRFDGYFTEHGNAQRVDPSDGIIPPGDYDFHVPGEEDGERYPVAASFFDWRFPHNAIPNRWQASRSPDSLSSISNIRSTTAILAQRDPVCRISACQEMPQQAHVVPQREQTWFVQNNMRQYTEEVQRHGPELLDNVENMLILRADLHMLWDANSFVLVPKGPQHETAVHVMRDSEELLELYHNRKTQPLFARYEFLFARFAWSLFPFILSFLQAGQPRSVSVRTDGGYVERSYSPAQCAQLASQRKRSVSPKKRKIFDGNSSTAEEPSGNSTHFVGEGCLEDSPVLRGEKLSDVVDPADEWPDNFSIDGLDAAWDGSEKHIKRRRTRSNNSQVSWGEESINHDYSASARPDDVPIDESGSAGDTPERRVKRRRTSSNESLDAARSAQGLENAYDNMYRRLEPQRGRPRFRPLTAAAEGTAV